MPNVGAEFTASIVIDKNDLITQALKQLSTAQKELEKNKLEIYFDLSNADLSKKLKEYQKQLSSTDYTIKINSNGIEETYKSLDKLLDIVKTIASGKDFGTGFGNINADNAVKQIDKLENRISELNKKYDELQKKSTSGSISGKEVNLVDNDEFKKLSQEVSELKGQFDDLKTHMSLLDDYTVPTDRFFELQTQVEATSVKVSDLVDEMTRLSNIQKNIGAETNISSGLKDAFQGSDTKLDETVSTAKELDKTLEQVDIPTDSFDTVLKKLDLAKSELIDIVKITKQSVSDADGKFHNSYTLKDSRGSTEIYGENSKTDKGQLLRSNIVGYDKKKDELDISKAQLEVDKQLAKEEEELAKAQQKKAQAFQKEQTNYENEQKKADALAKQKAAYDELMNTIKQYSEVAKRVASGNAEDGDIDKMSKLEDKISQLQKQPILSSSQVEKSEKSLVSLYDQLDKIEKKTAEVNQKNQEKAIQDEWDKNVKAIQNYMDAVTKLNKLKATDKGTGKNSEQIALQEQEVGKLKTIAYEARTAIDSVVNPHTADTQTWTQWVSAMEKFTQASNGSAESVAKLKDALRNAEAQAEKTQKAMLNTYDNRLESYNKKTSGYDATIARFEDGGWTSDAYLKNVQAVKDAVAEYERILNNLKDHPELVTEEGLNDLAKQEKLIKENITAVQNMSAAEKGFTKLSAQKELDKINNILKEHSGMSREAKNQIKAYYAQIKSGNPSASLDVIHAEIMKIVNAEVEAGRAGKSMFAAIKEKAFYGIAGAITTYFGFNDFLRYGREAIDTVVQLDDALVDLKKTTSMSSSELENFYYDANDVAKQMGVTTEEIINQASAWSRLNKIGLLYGDI